MSIEIIQSEENREIKMKKNEQNLTDLWDIIKFPNICIMGIPKGNQTEKETEKYLKK